jgi:hypothetical protein
MRLLTATSSSRLQGRPARLPAGVRLAGGRIHAVTPFRSDCSKLFDYADNVQ